MKSNKDMISFYKNCTEEERSALFFIVYKALASTLISYYSLQTLDDDKVYKYALEDMNTIVKKFNEIKPHIVTFNESWRNEETDSQFQNDATIDINLLMELVKNRLTS